jgi:PAS domain-containing protein
VDVHTRALELISSLYEAILDPERWQGFLTDLNSALGAQASVFQLEQGGGRRQGHVVAGIGLDADAQQRYAAYYSSINVWTTRGRHLLREGAVLTGEQICPSPELERTEYYSDYLRPLNLHHAVASVPAANPRTTLLISSLRAKRAGPFERQELELLQQLTPHLRVAAAIHHRLAEAEFHRAVLADALDRMPIGVALLDADARVLFANRIAERLMRVHDGFGLKGGWSARSGQHRFEPLLAAITAAGGQRDGAGSGGVVRISGHDGQNDLTFLVAPVSVEVGRLLTEQAAVALFVVDGAEAPTDTRLLQTLYDLTPSEARFAAGLARGLTVDQLADEHRLTRHSARWLTKQVLYKTGTHTQGQAISQILRGLASLIRPSG